jgi:NTE family protein
MTPKIGLVFAGGGAKGAYQAGAVKYLAEIDFVPHIIAGTSIGALNGAVLAANSNFQDAAKQLDLMWTDLGNANIIQPDRGAIAQLASYILQTSLPTLGAWATKLLESIGIFSNSKSVFDPAPIENFLRRAVDPQQLHNGIELWVAVFPSLNIPELRYDPAMLVIDMIRAKMGQDAHWLHVQAAKSDRQIYDILLASAAIPLAFPQREINGNIYVDGGFADNVPLGALAAQGCTHAIVIHLENGAIWNRHQFPNQTVIEIRPHEPINKSDVPLYGDAITFLDFSSDRIELLKQRGYADAKTCLEPILKTLAIEQDRQKSLDLLQCKTKELLADLPIY